MPLEGHLELINGLALQNFQKIEPDTSIPDESKWTEKVRHKDESEAFNT